MPGPPMFDPAMGDSMGGPSRTLRPIPRERTQYTPGASSSSAPVRLTLGPCASLSFDLTEDPKVARIAPFNLQW